MPEGHTIHRLARLHRRYFAGQAVRVTSPQGRFAEGARRLDGRVLEGVDAHGKHLFYRWGGGPLLHVHLGLVGRFRTHHRASPQPSPGARLRLATDGVAVDLSGPMTCRLVDQTEARAIIGRLGPDPLRPDADPVRFAEALARRRIAVGAALLDQGVISGIGNVYRAEGLFVCGIHPDRPARGLSGAQVEALWGVLRRMLRAGERSGQIVTVEPRSAGGRAAQRPLKERVHVYRRAGRPCRRCGAAIVSWSLGGRAVFACPRCQPD